MPAGPWCFDQVLGDGGVMPAERHGYDVIYADPPWAFNSNSVEKPGRNPRRHYQTMSTEAIAAMPVEDLCKPNAMLWMWIPGPLLMLAHHLIVMDAWGFKPSAIGFTWIKLKGQSGLFVTAGDLHTGNGFTTRKNAEFCVIGKRGRSLRVDAGVHEVVMSPVREHSRKPDEARDRIRRYVGPDRKILELFARQPWPGAFVWGNQATKFQPAK